MAYFEEELKKILNCYDNLIDLYSNVIRMSPGGRLIHQKNHDHDQFLLLNRENGVRTRSCITRDEELKSRLAQKEFADRALQILKTNADALREAEGKI